MINSVYVKKQITIKHGGSLAKSISEFGVSVRSSLTIYFYHFAPQKISDWVLLSPYTKQVNDFRSLHNWSETSDSSPSSLQNNTLYVKEFVYSF